MNPGASLLGCTLEEGFHLGRGVDLGLEGQEGHFHPSRERKRARGSVYPPNESEGITAPLRSPFFPEATELLPALPGGVLTLSGAEKRPACGEKGLFPEEGCKLLLFLLSSVSAVKLSH